MAIKSQVDSHCTQNQIFIATIPEYRYSIWCIPLLFSDLMHTFCVFYAKMFTSYHQCGGLTRIFSRNVRYHNAVLPMVGVFPLSLSVTVLVTVAWPSGRDSMWFTTTILCWNVRLHLCIVTGFEIFHHVEGYVVCTRTHYALALELDNKFLITIMRSEEEES